MIGSCVAALHHDYHHYHQNPKQLESFGTIAPVSDESSNDTTVCQTRNGKISILLAPQVHIKLRFYQIEIKFDPIEFLNSK